MFNLHVSLKIHYTSLLVMHHVPADICAWSVIHITTEVPNPMLMAEHDTLWSILLFGRKDIFNDISPPCAFGFMWSLYHMMCV
jgi:hypothetical protein